MPNMRKKMMRLGWGDPLLDVPSGDISAAELARLDGVTPGTVTASKALVVDANKRLDDLDVTALEIGNVDITATGTEINLLDGSSTANSTASVAAILDSAKKLRTGAATVGTANTGTTAVEYGDGMHHVTVLTVSTTLPAIAGGAALAVGKLLYTLPAGAQVIHAAYMSLGITQSEGNINADTPDGGLGTVIGSGAVATLDGTGTFENILTGQTFNNCTGTAEVKTAIPTAGASLVMEVGAAKTIHFNVADTWAASGDAAAALAGTVVLVWDTLA